MDTFNQTEIKLFKKYTSLIGVSGRENKIAKNLIEDYKAFGLEIIKDNLGSVYGLKKSKNPKFKVLLIAHMDEIGFIVKKVLSNGLIKGAAIGGINYSLLKGSKVLLKNKEEKILKGVVYAIDALEKADDALFDFGFRNDKEALENIALFDQIVPECEFTMLNNNKRMLAKAIDDRYGIVLGLEILKQFKDKELPFDLYVGGGVQEEVGCRGANIAAHNINPDLAIVLDCSTALDFKNECGALGKGVLLRYFDPSMIAFEELIQFQEKAALKAKAPYQYFETRGGTDAGIIHKAEAGIMTLTHCIVGRNIHSGITIIDAIDYHSAKASLVKLLMMLDEKEFNKLKEYRH